MRYLRNIFYRVLPHRHHNCYYERSALGPPLFPVECNLCGDYFYVTRPPKGCTCKEEQ